MPMLPAGESAPDFALRDHHDNMVRLADFQGRYIILWFYPRANTPG